VTHSSDARRVILALDIGGTRIRAAAILPDGSCLAGRSAPTPLAESAEVIYCTCASLLTEAAEALPAAIDRPSAIGISSMGPVDPWRGLVVDPPNVPALHHGPLANEMEARLGLPAFLERDTNVAALAERWAGAARGVDDFLYITVSTGLGGAIFHEGSLLLGPDGTAGELGHGTAIEGGPPCGCGGLGHLEGVAAGAGLARQAAHEVAGGRSAFLQARAALAPLTARDVAEGDVEGDETCAQLMVRARRAFAIACVGWVNSLNPTLIVVGGALAAGQGDRWLEPARDEVRHFALRTPAARVRIVPAALGDDVGLIGAWPLVEARIDDPTWRRGRPVGPQLVEGGRSATSFEPQS
jgi:glucokinase